jgi:hypothetical protein|tara:strand:- start:374 stop:568 length:195 start_codon:yes stop_codon:yes gene_type:complete
MKITRLKRGYRLHMSDAEFDLYSSALDEGFAGLSATEENDLFNKINGTEKISDWFVVADDRRST